MTLVSGRLGEVEPPFAQQPGIERRLRYGDQHVDHRGDDPGLLNELFLGLEDGRIVVVETQDHAAPNLNTGPMDRCHPFKHGGALTHVLKFLGFPQRFLVRQFDTDENAHDVGVGQQPHHFRIIGQIEGLLGDEGQGIAVRLLPRDDRTEHLLDRLLVAEQVVVDDGDERRLVAPRGLELGDDLGLGLDSRNPAEDDDDVAELAAKRTASRKPWNGCFQSYDEDSMSESVILLLDQHGGRGKTGLTVFRRPIILLPSRVRPGAFTTLFPNKP